MEPSFFKRFFFIAVILVIGVGLWFGWGWLKKPAPAPVIKAPVASGPQHQIIGASVEGRDIEAFTYGQGPTHLLFVGGIHGGYEWNGVVLAYQFIDYLNDNPAAIPSDLSVTIIPSANPDGVFKVVGKEGRFTADDIPNGTSTASGRMNADGVDLNRNFDCHWKPKSMWQNKTVSAGSAVFSEPEAQAIRNFVQTDKPVAVVFWHSQSGTVYASQCDNGILPSTLKIMKAYAQAAGYKTDESFDSYSITGDAEGWLASINIPAITVELQTHATIEWDKNLAGFQALLKFFSEGN